jgi:hypothetical protein
MSKMNQAFAHRRQSNATPATGEVAPTGITVTEALAQDALHAIVNALSTPPVGAHGTGHHLAACDTLPRAEAVSGCLRRPQHMRHPRQLLPGARAPPPGEAPSPKGLGSGHEDAEPGAPDQRSRLPSPPPDLGAPDPATRAPDPPA